MAKKSGFILSKDLEQKTQYVVPKLTMPVSKGTKKVTTTTVKPLVGMSDKEKEKAGRTAMETARVTSNKEANDERQRLGRIMMGVEKGTKADIDKANRLALGTKESAFATQFLDPLRLTDVNKSKEYQQDRLKAEKEFSTASALGSVAGLLVPGAIATTGLKAGTKLVKPLVTKTAETVGKGLVKTGVGKNIVSKAIVPLTEKVTEGALLGAGYTGVQNITPLLKETKDINQVGSEIVQSLGTGATLDVGLYGLGKLAKPLLAKIAKGQTLSKAEKSIVAKQANVSVDNVDNVVNNYRKTIQEELGLPKDKTAQQYKAEVESQAYYDKVKKDTELALNQKNKKVMQNLKQQSVTKVIKNEDGTPKTLYHGTGQDFDVFDKSKRGSFTGADSSKKGFFFTDSPSVADSYRSGSYEYKQIDEFINTLDENELRSISNSLERRYGTTWEDDADINFEYTKQNLQGIAKEINKEENIDGLKDFVRAVEDSGVYNSKPNEYKTLLDTLKKGYGVRKEANLDIKNPYVVDVSDVYEDGFFNNNIDKAIKEGYDGVIFKNVYDSFVGVNGSELPPSDVYVAFEPEQIKKVGSVDFVDANKTIKPLPNLKQRNIVKPLLSDTVTPQQPIKQLLDTNITNKQKDVVGDSVAFNTHKESTSIPLPKNTTVKPLIEPTVNANVYIKTKVLTDLPQVPKLSAQDKLRGLYQNVVTKDLPLETIGKTYEPVRNLTNVARKSGGTVNYHLENEQVDMAGNRLGDSLVDIFKRIGKNDIQDLSDYSMHKHNIKRFEEGKPVFGNDVDSNMSATIASNIENAKPYVKDLQQELNQYTKNLKNEWLVKSGILNEETSKMLDEMYPDYLPTNRVQDTIKQLQTQGSTGSVRNPVKKAKGSAKDILPIDQQLAVMTNNAIRAARKNEMYNSLNKAFENNPEFVGRFFKPIEKTAADLTDGIDGILKTYDDPIRKVGDTYELNYYQNGEKVKAQISKDLYDAIKPMTDPSGLEKTLEVVNKYATKPFKELVTGKNLLFMVSNIMRDFPTAFINSNDGIEWSKQIPNAIKEIATNGKAWKQYQALGGTQGNIFTYDKGFKSPISQADSKLVKGARSTMKPLETIGNVTEAVPRFAEYLATVKKGGGTYESMLEGVYRASEVSTDFSRGGSVTKSVDKVVPYLNPSVQGIDKFVRQLKNKPLETIVKNGLVMTLPTVMLDQINKNNREYKELSPREKNNFFLIPNGDKFIRIPKSRENGLVFSTLFDWIARRSRGEKVTGEEVASALQEMLPVNAFENSIITPALKAMSQIKDPNADVRNYANMSIVPTSLKRLPVKEQYDQYTSEVAKAIGGTLDLSPKVVDYLMRSYGGIIAQTTLPKLSPSQRGVVESKFTTDPVFKSDLSNKLYDIVDKKEQKNTLNKRDDKEDPQLEKQLKLLRKVTKELSELKKQQKEIDKSKLDKDLKELKIRELQKTINSISRDTLNSGSVK